MTGPNVIGNVMTSLDVSVDGLSGPAMSGATIGTQEYIIINNYIKCILD